MAPLHFQFPDDAAICLHNAVPQVSPQFVPEAALPTFVNDDYSVAQITGCILK